MKWIDLHSSTQFNSLDESAKKILIALYNSEQIFTDRLEISTNEVKQHVTDEIRLVKARLQYLNDGVEEVLLILRAPSPGIPALDRQQGEPRLRLPTQRCRHSKLCKLSTRLCPFLETAQAYCEIP